MKQLKLFIFIIFISLGLLACASRSFKNAQQINTIAAYDKFLKENADSEYVPKVIEMREKLWFENSKIKNTINSYSRYLKEYPSGKFVNEAMQNIEYLWFKRSKKCNTIDSYDSYLKKFTNGKFVNEAKQTKELIWFARSKEDDTIDSFNSYLKEYPQGQFVAIANERISFLNAKKLDTMEAYDHFLTKYPRGEYSADAYRLREKSHLKKIKRNNRPINFIWSTKKNSHNYYSYFDNTTDLYVALTPDNKKRNAQELTSLVQTLVINGQGGWRLPTKKEFERMKTSVESSNDSNIYYIDNKKIELNYQFYSAPECKNGIGRVVQRFNHKNLSYICDAYKISFNNNIIVRDRNIYDDIIEGISLTLNEKIEKLTDLLLAEKLNLKQLLPEKSEHVQNVYREVFSKAIHMLLGNPILKDFTYNAGRKVFKGVLKSENGRFERKIELYSPLKKAKKLQTKYLSRLFIPSITFNIDWPELKFADLQFVDNTIKQKIENFGVYASLSDGTYIELEAVTPYSTELGNKKFFHLSDTIGLPRVHYITSAPIVTLNMKKVNGFIVYGVSTIDEKTKIYYFASAKQTKKIFYGNNGDGTKDNSFINTGYTCGVNDGMRYKKLKNRMYFFKYPIPETTEYKYCKLSKRKHANVKTLETNFKINFFGWWYDDKYWIFQTKN